MSKHMDHWDRSDVIEDIECIDRILTTNIFTPENVRSPFLRAAFIEVLVALRDLMYKAEKYASRISFTDDVTVNQRVTDVTALIKFVRDALCHRDSDDHFIENGNIKATFNVCFGKGVLLKTPTFEQNNPYTDDTCFFFGYQRIFLRRHILRAYEEAKQKLRPILNAS